jgi:hypothetical protein
MVCLFVPFRNCMYASRAGGTRNMIYYHKQPDGSVKEYPIKWDIIQKAFEYSQKNYGSTRPSTLTANAVYLTNFSKVCACWKL